jgi:hypothetical protein
MEMHQAQEEISRLIHEDKDKDVQFRLVVAEFRGVEYIQLRKFYRDFDGEWKPSVEGVALPLTIECTRELFIGLMEILSLAESKDILEKHFKDILDTLYVK